MAISAGQRFVRRHNAARSSTSNTTAADIAYDTAVLSEGGYSWSSPEVTVDTAGKYLCIYDIGEVQLASTRAVGTLVPSINTTDQTLYKARHRYLRNSGGNHGVSFGAAILDLAVNDDVKIRNPGVVSGTDALGNYATNVNQGGGLQLVYLGDNNFTEVQRTTSQSPIAITYANATRPWLDSTPTWTQITFTSEVVDDDNLYGGSGGDITLKANKKYLIVYGASFDGSSSQRHTHHLALDIGGTRVQHSTGYERNNSSDAPPMQGMYLHEVGGSDETLKLQGAVEQEDNTVSNTVGCDNAYVQVYELPDSAEWIHVDNGATDSLATALASTSTYYDTPLSSTFRADGDSNLSLDSGNDAVQNDSGASLPILAIGWHMWDRDAGTSGTRKHAWSYWDNGGSRLAYGISGGYNRGQQGNDDTHRLGYTGAALMDLANGADLSFVVRDPQSGANSDMGVYASTSRHFLGVQVLNLDTLDAVTDTELVIQESSHGHSAENLGLTQDHMLVVADGQHSHSAENLALTQAHLLAIQDSLHSHSAESLDLIQDHLLAIQDAVHSHSAENLDLAQDHMLAIAEALHDHVADNLDLTQAHLLAINDASHAHTAENLVLVQQHLLAIQESLHGHTAENLELTQDQLLVIAEALHAHSAEVINLTQQHTLAIQDASHGHTAENIGLIQQHMLAIQEALHAHSAENVPITTDTALVIEDALHAHNAENVVLTQAHLLAIQEALHAHTAENLALTQAHLLVIDDSQHVHTAENLGLTQDHMLAIQDAVHGHTADNLDLIEDVLLAIQEATHSMTSENIELEYEGDIVLVIQNATHGHTADTILLEPTGSDKPGIVITYPELYIYWRTRTKRLINIQR